MCIGVMAWGMDDSTRRVGIFIGSNNGGRDRTMLRYAVSDARTVSRVFAEMGGVRGADNVLLVEPDIQELGRVIDQAQELVQNAKQTAKRTELVFYYSGHSDEIGLLLGPERYSYQALRARINQIPSDMRIVILDSCASGAFTRTKGGTKTQPFLIDTSVSVEGYAFLTSSSATESSQESDRIEGSYFTHNLVAGLRGAADTVGDGQVTLNEVYRFAYAETLAVTETSLYGAQHPSYDMQVSGSGDVVLTNVRENSASLLIEAALSGRLSIRDGEEHLIAEITKIAGKPIELGLETGSYRITLQQGDTFYRATLFLAPDTQTRLSMRDFALIAASPATARGTDTDDRSDTDDKSELWPTWLSGYYDFAPDDYDFTPDDDEPVGYGAVSFQWVSSFKSKPKKVTNNLFLGLVSADNYNLYGLGFAFIGLLSSNNALGWETAGGYIIAGNNMTGVQIAGLVNIAGRSMTGIQTAGLLNVAGGSMTGIHAAGLLNVAGGSMTGIHAAGLVNVAAGSMSGIHAAGLFNFAGGTDWMQAEKSNIHSSPFNVIGTLFRWQIAGIFNVTGNDFYGIQVAPVNISGQNKKNGLSLQLGLVNISKNERVLPIGLVNVVKNGILNPAIYYDTYEMLNVSFRSGSKYFYSLFSVASSQVNFGQLSIGKADAGELLAFRAGLGFEFPLGALFLDMDVTTGILFDVNDEYIDMNDIRTIKNQYTNTIQGRITLGLMFSKNFSIFAGVSYDYFKRNQTLGPIPKYSWDDVLPSDWSNEQHVHKLGFFAGVQF